MKLHPIAISVLLLLAGAQAQAADSFMEIINASGTRTTTAANKVLGAGQSMVIGSLRSVIDASQTAELQFDWVGGSTPVADYFTAFSRTLLSTGSGLTATGAAVDSGLVDLAFGRNVGAAPVVTNASNFDGIKANFGVVLNADRQSGYLLFEDARLGSDYDYDDMVLRFKLNVSTTAPVPEPSSVLLSLAGLGLLGGVVRRRQRRGNAA
jgi:hypothetical protein